MTTNADEWGVGTTPANVHQGVQNPNAIAAHTPHVHQGVQHTPTTTAPIDDTTPSDAASVANPTNYSEENVYKEPTKWSARQVPIVILACNSEDLVRINDGIKQDSVAETTEGLEWLYWLTTGLENKLNTQFGTNALSDAVNYFVKRVATELGPVIGAKKVGVDNSSETLTAASAKHLLRGVIGSGATRRWPLYSSGFWLTTSTPLEEDLLALDDRIAEEKTSLGARTAGLAFSVSMSYIFKHVINLIASSTISTNIEDPEFNKADVFSYVKLVDVWGLVGFYASLIYPNGYAVRIPCTADNDCTHTDSAYIDILDILRVNRAKLTPEQVEWMADAKVKRTLKEINAYQEKYSVSASTEIMLEDDDLSAGTITYTIGTVEDYISSSEMWIEEISNKVDAMISERTTLARRDQLLEEHFRLSICREYQHCIKSIHIPAREMDDGSMRVERLIKDPVSIGVLLSEYSTNPTFHGQIIGSINKFLDSRTITHVGIPPHRCSKCKEMSSKANLVTGLTTLIPLDPFTTFFTVRNQKLQRSMLKKAQD